ncbi:hypothetical protein E3N88_22502 [Mikania micrantha]|uniref:1-phosphatidylinositol-3-phosphate 5-kinase n=1 Tax=Mikania micrantha TaxID=192012 RepID=A0A5N6NAM7_9ASTR|nr:hypothetical protein E3N88_22502 [Mikania micrantha]
MDAPLSDLLGALKSWGVPRRPEPVNLSRDFWMPDQSCRVCYECDSQFTLFNRRHHCRFCGRVFCAKCTQNWAPSSDSREESGKIRVCNYCFKQWQQGGLADHEIQTSNLDLSTSPSASYISTKSSGTADSSCITFTSAVSSFQQNPSHCQSLVMDSNLDEHNALATKNNQQLDVENYSPSQPGLCMNRGDEFNNSRHLSHVDDAYYDQLQFDDYGSRKVHPDGVAADASNSLLQNSFERNEDEHDVSDECEASSSSLYAAQGIDSDPVDIEKNEELWLPPEPEDEEDEREALSFYDDDDENDNGDGVGEWGYGNSGSGEFRNRDRSNEEHKKAMKNIVDGHFRALVSQLFQAENPTVIDEDDKDSWLEIITSLSWEAASLLKPDTSKGGGMDPGGYVKIKCLASGRPFDSMVVKGVVCKKNVAHRRMTSRIEKPRILILGGALEYQRVSNLLSSFDTLLQQEMDHLKMAVTKIDAHQPDVLLVEKSVSRLPKAFWLHSKSFSHYPLVALYVDCEGNPSASGDELKKVKRVVQYGVFAAYHLALETSFLADEGASLPELPLNSPLTVALPEKASTIDRSISTIPGFSMKDTEPPRSSSLPMSDVFSSIMNKKSQTTLLPLGECNKFQDRPLASVHDSSTTNLDGSDATKDFSEAAITNGDLVKISQTSDDMETDDQFWMERMVVVQRKSFLQHHRIIKAFWYHCHLGVWRKGLCVNDPTSFASNTMEILINRWDVFSEIICLIKCPSCEMSSEAHVQCYTHRQGTLTISVKKLTGSPLPGEKDGKIWMWHRCLRCPRINGFLPSTRRIVMSDAAWGLSFGKFLELSFSNHAAASRVANCGHSLHRDCLRFYGFGEMVACFRYASINVHSVYLPPSKLVFKYENQEWIKSEVNEIVSRAELLFSEILNALTQISEKIFGKKSSNNNANMTQSRRHIAELEVMLQKEKTEFEESLENILNKKCHGMVDIFEINRLRRQLLFQSYVWDHRLVYAASVNNNNPRGDLNDSKSEIVDKVNGLLLDSDISETDDKKQIQSEVMVDSCPKEENNSDVGFHRAVSEGQLSVMASLSDTLDAAWTGNHPGSDLNDPDDKGDHGEDHTPSSFLSPTLSMKGSESTEESSSWFSMPFLNFYRSLNKNLLPTTQKLEALNDYKPVYIRDLELQGGARLLLSVGINDIVVPVYDDEPTSFISYALLSHDYVTQMSGELKEGESLLSSQSADSVMFQSFNSFDDLTLESVKSSGDESLLLSMSGSRASLILDPLSYTKALHARVEFSDDSKVRYSVTCYYAKRFEALRRMCCPAELDYVRSLSRCKKWGAQGGKSNVFFAKTLDERFIIKQVTKTELESFIKFAPAYFKYLSESIDTGSPTCLAKILGIYQVARQTRGGREFKMDVLVMENLLYERNLTRLYDLKGSSRSRYNPDASGSNKVLLDQNLIEAMPTSPIFVGNKAKRLLERAVWNDTAFLASIDVMDYSLLVGVDEEKHELVLGIIDFMRQYTWDKHLETWVKASGILGGPKNASPTVISPKQYKKRFRKAMTTYFLMVPDQWSPPAVVPTKSQTDLSEENTQGGGNE